MQKLVALPLTLFIAITSLAPTSMASDSWRCGKRRERGGWDRREPVKKRLDDRRQIAWQCAILRMQGRVLIVRFHLSDGCQQLDDVKVGYRPNRITVTLVGGDPNLPAGTGCTLALVPASVRIRLDQDRSGRRIVDGSRR